ncbi:helix-turn-helix domain-containing protein [Bosea sp. 685]|uniref:helix-turn-helix domain-containing protein n=1 Tax=Bosea sp. 685 TaxID=3080057 RepID=UPI002892BBEF|nr:helix-turn-helix domain-containing protein [Bosea sp. 685]WNJ87920.1 helix-turn-helix domain-containing protein [Bosea sp. 685]
MTEIVNIMTDGSTDPDPTRAVHAAIAGRIALLRKARRLSFDQLAARCGVSKGMLVQIEQGKANPSIGTLCRLASGLGVSVAELVEVAEAGQRPIRIIAPGEGPILWQGPFGGTARLLIGSDGPEMFEQWMWELHPGERFEAQVHPAGTQELVSVLEGSLVLELGGSSHVIEQGARRMPEPTASMRMPVPGNVRPVSSWRCWSHQMNRLVKSMEKYSSPRRRRQLRKVALVGVHSPARIV